MVETVREFYGKERGRNQTERKGKERAEVVAQRKLGVLTTRFAESCIWPREADSEFYLCPVHNGRAISAINDSDS